MRLRSIEQGKTKQRLNARTIEACPCPAPDDSLLDGDFSSPPNIIKRASSICACMQVDVLEYYDAFAYSAYAVGRCKLDPSLKAPCFQPLNLRVHTSLSI